MNKQIFISYRRDDTSWVTTSIYQSLLKSFSQDQIFRDVDSIPYGVDFFELIEKEVSKCHVFIAVIGEDWLRLTDVTNTLENSTDFVRIEIATAFKHQVRVIPVIVDGARMPKPNELPDEIKPLARINAVPISHERFNTDINQLISILQGTLDQASLQKAQMEEEERKAQEELKAKNEAERRQKIKEGQELKKIEAQRKKNEDNDRFKSQVKKEWSKREVKIFLLCIGIVISSFFIGIISSALIAGILEASSNKKIDLDTTLGWTMFWTCTFIPLAIMSFRLIKRVRKKS